MPLAHGSQYYQHDSSRRLETCSEDRLSHPCFFSRFGLLSCGDFCLPFSQPPEPCLPPPLKLLYLRSSASVSLSWTQISTPFSLLFPNQLIPLWPIPETSLSPAPESASLPPCSCHLNQCLALAYWRKSLKSFRFGPLKCHGLSVIVLSTPLLHYFLSLITPSTHCPEKSYVKPLPSSSNFPHPKHDPIDVTPTNDWENGDFPQLLLSTLKAAWPTPILTFVPPILEEVELSTWLGISQCDYLPPSHLLWSSIPSHSHLFIWIFSPFTIGFSVSRAAEVFPGSRTSSQPHTTFSPSLHSQAS